MLNQRRFFVGAAVIAGAVAYLVYSGIQTTSMYYFNIEQFFATGTPPYPIERTLLTSGMVIAGVESMYAGQKPYETPQMAVAYQGPKESMYWRE